MNLGALIPLLILSKDVLRERGPSFEAFGRTFGPKTPSISTVKPTAKKITISIGQTPLILPVGFELVGPSIIGMRRPKGLT